eukprot:40025_1
MATEENGTNKEVESVEMTTTTDNDQTKIVEQPDHEIDLVPLEGKHWALTLIIDFCVIAAMGVRDYFNPNTRWNIVIGHYYSWIPITDSLAFWLNPNRRGWWLPFRALTSIETTVLNVIFLLFNREIYVGFEEYVILIYIVRFGVCIIYMAHSFYMLKRYGPTYDNLAGLAAHLKNHTVQPAPSIFFALFALFGGNIFYRFHWNYGMQALDAPLTGIQTARSITVFTKAAFISVLIVDLFYRGLAHLIVSMLFIVQWFMFPEMFMKAPIPYCHCVGEVAFVAWSLFLLHNAGWKPRNDVNWKGYTIHLWKKMINN